MLEKILVLENLALVLLFQIRLIKSHSNYSRKLMRKKFMTQLSIALVCFLVFQAAAFAVDVEKEYRSTFEQGAKLILRKLRPTSVFQAATLIKAKEDTINAGGLFKGRVEIKWTGIIKKTMHTMVVDIWLTPEGANMYMTKYNMQKDDGPIPIVLPKEGDVHEQVGSRNGNDF